MDGLSDTGYVMNSDPCPMSFFATPGTIVSFVQVVVCSKPSQGCAITISYLDVVDMVRTLQLKICEVDVNDIAFGNFNCFPLDSCRSLG